MKHTTYTHIKGIAFLKLIYKPICKSVLVMNSQYPPLEHIEIKGTCRKYNKMRPQ